MLVETCAFGGSLALPETAAAVEGGTGEEIPETSFGISANVVSGASAAIPHWSQATGERLFFFGGRSEESRPE